MSKKRYTQCWRFRTFPRDFIGKRGKPVNWCKACQGRYGNWSRKTPAQRAAVARVGVPLGDGQLRARLYRRSSNRKLGGIPSSVTARGTRPPSCGFYAAGCYALYHVLAHHWRQATAAGDDWETFCHDVMGLPSGQLWRHNVAGDLPGAGGQIAHEALNELVNAQRGCRGFTFTHKPVLDGRWAAGNRVAIARANSRGFTVNLSADTLAQADQLTALGIGPVAVVLPSDAPLRLKTPAGRRVVVCPAELHAEVTCASCQLCAKPWRKSVVGFRAHGQSAAVVSDLVRRSP